MPAKAVEPAGFTPDQKQAIEKIIKSYLVANPEIFLEVQTALEEKSEKDQAQKFKVAITENADEIYRQPNAPTAGNPNGDITVVEFFDYNCGYCKRGLGDVAKLVETDPKVRLVFKELPILSKGSQEASTSRSPPGSKANTGRCTGPCWRPRVTSTRLARSRSSRA